VRPWLRFLLNVLTWVILIVGAIAILRFLWRFGGALLSHVSLAGSWSAIVEFLREDGALWLSAIATGMLWFATRALCRSTNIQLAIDGPALELNLSLMAPPQGTRASPYFWDLEDIQDVTLAPHVIGVPPSYVYLEIVNQQNKPTGVAGGVQATVSLHFEQHSVRRVIRAELIRPQTFVIGPILNVGNLTAYYAVVDKVEYRDISGRRRTAAWGTNTILQPPAAAPISGETIFEPRKGEYSDGHR
jgi:hypothetical protein